MEDLPRSGCFYTVTGSDALRLFVPEYRQAWAQARLIYPDLPYTAEQYNRFYHLAEHVGAL
ncbi:MAG: hypothetical protein IMW99_05930 [Firmicutes bacterium]|nr:hypothetical protein [Bacillota bacterium]